MWKFQSSCPNSKCVSMFLMLFSKRFWNLSTWSEWTSMVSDSYWILSYGIDSWNFTEGFVLQRMFVTSTSKKDNSGFVGFLSYCPYLVFFRLVWVFAGRTCHFVGFVMRRLSVTLSVLVKLYNVEFVKLPSTLIWTNMSQLMRLYVRFVLLKVILQTHMRSHPVGLDVWFLVGCFVYFHTSCVRTANALVRLCGCSSVWDPPGAVLQEELESVQKRAARFVTGNYSNYSYETGRMTGILGQLKWESLKKRRKDNGLIFLYKGLKGKASVPTDDLIRQPKHPCTICSKGMIATIKAVSCDTCDQ